MARVKDRQGNFVDFSESNEGEEEPYSFDFKNELITGETVVGASFELLIDDESEVDDLTPMTRLYGVPAVSDGRYISTYIKGQLPGVTYILKGWATTSRGSIKLLYAHLPVLPIE